MGGRGGGINMIRWDAATTTGLLVMQCHFIVDDLVCVC